MGIEPNDLERFLTDDAATYLEMGFTQFTLGFDGPSWAVDGGVAWLAWRDERNSVRGAARQSRVDATAG